jgi:ABC-type sugar transport system permease subunit
VGEKCPWAGPIHIIRLLLLLPLLLLLLVMLLLLVIWDCLLSLTAFNDHHYRINNKRNDGDLSGMTVTCPAVACTAFALRKSHLQ